MHYIILVRISDLTMTIEVTIAYKVFNCNDVARVYLWCNCTLLCNCFAIGQRQEVYLRILVSCYMECYLKLHTARNKSE